MEDRRLVWNKYYTKHGPEEVNFDDWMQKHRPLLKKEGEIVEFGCGFGFMSASLLAAGFRVLSTDLAPAALDRLKGRVPAARVQTLDLEQPLPFPDSSFDYLIADLCLHYFDRAATARIVSEFSRILGPDGLACGRVNSAEDYHYGAGQGREIERGFYEQDGHYKRFFDEAMIREFFSGWEIVSLLKYDISRHANPKNVYEFVMMNTKEV